MDQDNSNGQDKRNWRERLGIGAQGGSVQNGGGNGGRDLPRISDDFQKEAPPVSARPIASAKPAPRAAAVSGVKPAPMAPRAVAPVVSRANPKVISPAATVSPDKLAERLRSQREASTKLAEQRVQVAKQRAEAQHAPVPVAQAPGIPAAKPKFTFAEESAAAKPVAPAQTRSTAPVVQQQQPVAPQLAPARPPLGGQAAAPSGFSQRPTPAPFQPQPAPNYPPTGFSNQPFQPNYQQQPVPPYRPIDPSTGYAPQPGYVPQPPVYVPQQRGFGPPPQQQGGFAPPPANGPRLNMPQRSAAGLNPNLAAPQGGFNVGPRLNPMPTRAPTPRVEPEGEYEEEFYDELPSPRGGRPTSTDYQEAYREAEYGYEEEAPRSKAPWILAGLVLATMLMAGLGVWLYQSSIKPLMTGQSGTQEVPAVAPPEAPAKVQAEKPAAATEQPAAATPSKKQIYDRIVGDQEILGGDVAPAAETPAAIPEPSTLEGAAPEPAGGAGEDAAPLPIPPPPGAAGEQQGSIAPIPEKQSAENISPATGESQVAVAAPGDDVAEAELVPPTPGEISTTEQTPVAEEIVDKPIVAVEKKKPVVAAKKKIEAPKQKQVATETPISKPVVLVPPSKKAKAAAPKPIVSAPKPIVKNDTDTASEVAVADDAFYDSNETAPVPKKPIVVAPKKKKTLSQMTLGDLFNNDDTVEPSKTVAKATLAKPNPSVVSPKPVKPASPPEQVANNASGFMVQLASFRSKAEASTEFTRLKAKHSGALGRFSPIITEATVGGATRYRLSVGSIDSQAKANAVCSSLFAGGERDCLVKRR
jgi:SPOR domain